MYKKNTENYREEEHTFVYDSEINFGHHHLESTLYSLSWDWFVGTKLERIFSFERIGT